jgi:hypothetical protein
MHYEARVSVVRRILGVVLLASTLPCAAQTLVAVAVTPANPSIANQTTQPFAATGTYSDGSQKNLTNSVTWSSSASSVASMTAAGVATGHKLGTAMITATASGIAGSTALTVSGLLLLAVTPANPVILKGTTQQFNATAILVGQQTHTQDLTSQVTWSASPASTATVSVTGVATGVAAGSATIKAALRTYSGSAVLNVSSTPPPNLGQWSAPFGLGAIGIHAALLRTGQVLLYQYGTPYGNGNRSCCSLAKVFDPNSYTITDVTLPFTRDIFCSGLNIQANGQVVITGGTYDPLHEDAGIFDTTIFDPETETWSDTGLMNYARWYPSNVELPDGTTLTMAGSNQAGNGRQRSLEIYSPATGSWTALPASANMQDKPEPELYPSLFLLPNGTVVDAGPNQTTRAFSPATKTWSTVGNMNYGYRDHESSVLLPGLEKVLISGGSPTPNSQGTTYTNTAEVIDFSSSTPAWVYTGNMNIGRYHHMLVLLGDGTVLAVGGAQNGHYGSPVFVPELYNPTTGIWTQMASQAGQRGYHSTALLLPDGRVLSAGSDSSTPWQQTLEIYSPPYLFQGARPVISSAPANITYGANFTLTTPDAGNVTRVALIRPGAVTHSTNFDQRYVDLTWQGGQGQLTVTTPSSSNLAPPGFYMLVIVNSNGIPSVMPFLQLQ